MNLRSRKGKLNKRKSISFVQADYKQKQIEKLTKEKSQIKVASNRENKKRKYHEYNPDGTPVWKQSEKMNKVVSKMRNLSPRSLKQTLQLKIRHGRAKKMNFKLLKDADVFNSKNTEILD